MCCELRSKRGTNASESANKVMENAVNTIMSEDLAQARLLIVVTGYNIRIGVLKRGDRDPSVLDPIRIRRSEELNAALGGQRLYPEINLYPIPDLEECMFVDHRLARHPRPGQEPHIVGVPFKERQLRNELLSSEDAAALGQVEDTFASIMRKTIHVLYP